MVKKYYAKKGRYYWPTSEMKKIANITNPDIYKIADKNPVRFWEEIAKSSLSWFKPWKKTYKEKLPYFWWFLKGRLNISYNCLDRHLEQGYQDKTALIWVPEPTKEKTKKITYLELFKDVNRFANFLKSLGVRKGDVVGIYLPLVPETIIAMLACTRIGAIHSVVFSAFSAEALKKRLIDGSSKVLITSDGYYRRGEKSLLINQAQEAIRGTKIRKVVVVNRISNQIPYDKTKKVKYYSFKKEIKKAIPYCEPVKVKSEDTSFILYTSGTTGKPKGIVHDTGGYAVQSYITTKLVFDLKKEDIMWCTADIGWITGHTYACYGPLLNGATTLLYEGAPDYPNPSRWWRIINENKVSVFYTAPTAIRMFAKLPQKYILTNKLGSLRILGSVGEPIDEEAWLWYFRKIGQGRCPIIDTWWQTETGGTIINTLPGIGPSIPTISGKSFPGTRHAVVNDSGKLVKKGKSGYLVQLSPFTPGMLHGVYKNHRKYVKTYWKKFKNRFYDTSDGAYITKDGYFRLTGRVDDVMKVAGHRLATAEVENAIDQSDFVNESAVVPFPDTIKGEVPVAFVVPKIKIEKQDIPNKEKEIISQVIKEIGPTAKPARVYFVDDLPKTRSGKIMRRVLKAILVNEEPEGLMTLVNPEAVEKIKAIVKNGS